MRFRAIFYLVNIAILLMANAPVAWASICSSVLVQAELDNQIRINVLGELEEGSPQIPELIARVATSGHSIKFKIQQIKYIMLANEQIERSLAFSSIERMAEKFATASDANEVHVQIASFLIYIRKFYYMRKAEEAKALAAPKQASAELNERLLDFSSLDFQKTRTRSLDIYTYANPVPALALLNALPAFEGVWPRVTRQLYRPRPIAAVYEIQELPGVFLTLFNHIEGMNDVFQRASLAIEGKKWPLNGLDLLGVFAGGHDLRGVDLVSFWSKAQASRASDLQPSIPVYVDPTILHESVRRIETEKDFFHSVVLPTLKARGAENVTFLAASANATSRRTVTHEIWHGFYYSNPSFQEAVRVFWSESLREDERLEVKKMLFLYGYDTNDEELVRNEFQAYMLQLQNPAYSDSESEQWEKYVVSKYSTRLKAYLSEKSLQLPGL